MEGISQSLLKKLWTNPSDYINPPQEETDYFSFGTMVDEFLLGKNTFYDKYYVSNTNITPRVQSVIDEYYRTVQGGIVGEIDNKLIVDIAKRQQFDGRLKKDEAFIKAIVTKDSLNYLADIPNIGNKKVISSSDIVTLNTIERNFNSNPYTSGCFIQPNGDIEVINKLVIQFTVEDRLCKAELDKVIIDHQNKTVSPIDLKTTSDNPYNFNYSFFKYGYHVQSAWYTEALRQWLVSKSLISYTITEYLFPVVNSISLKVGQVIADENIINAGWNGYTDKYGNQKEGVKHLLNRLTFHEVYGFDYPMEYYQNNGCLISID
jgi:hypothetical protein